MNTTDKRELVEIEFDNNMLVEILEDRRTVSTCPITPAWFKENGHFQPSKLVRLCPFGCVGNIIRIKHTNIGLTIVTLSVMHLHDIIFNDDMREGVLWYSSYSKTDFSISHLNQFETLWNSIYRYHNGCSYDANPWVWRLEFKLIKATLKTK